MHTRSPTALTTPRWSPAPAWLIDAAIGTSVLVVALLTTAGGQSGKSGVVYRDRDAVAVALIVVFALPFFVRSRVPTAMFVVSSLAAVALMMRGYDAGGLPLMTLFGAYTVAAYRPLRVVIPSGVFIAGLLVLMLATDTRGFDVGGFVTSGSGFASAFLLGWAMQTRRHRIDAFEDEQAAAAAQAAAEERLRIAQELHDVVAHSLGVIAVQAGVGLHLIDSKPDEARRSLEVISRTSRASLTEIRQLLGVVRDSGSPTYVPAPGLSDLKKLARDVTDAGLTVEVRVDGSLDDVPAGVGLAAYRIVQEALTNALRHSGAARATVHLESDDGLLAVEVVDNGRGPDANKPASGGHGLVGMRERVAVYGGSLFTGPGGNGGFKVAANLPYEPESQT